MDKKEALKLVQESGHELENLPKEFKKNIIYKSPIMLKF